MDLFDQLRMRIGALIRGRQIDADMDREMQLHVEMETAKNVRDGVPVNESRRLAHMAFGGRQRFREEARDELRSRALADLAQDLRHATRTFRRTPAFTLTVIATLAIGIGATTVIFSVTDNVVLRGLPLSHADRMVSVGVLTDQYQNLGPTQAPNAAHYLVWKAGCSLCEAMALLRPQSTTLYGAGDPVVLPAMGVSDNLFAMLGARAQVGRLIVPGDDSPGNDHIVVISDALWHQRFGARSDIVGRSITLGRLGSSHTVIGVTPPEFSTTYGNMLASFTRRPVRADLFFPVSLLPYQRTTTGEHNYGVLALLKPGATAVALRAQLDAITVANAQQLRNTTPERSAVTPLQQQVVGTAGRPLLLLLAAVVTVLLIMCVNLANLFLARGAARRRESAVRVALGAAHGRLVRQALTETLGLSIVGGSIGIALSYWGVRGLVALAPPELPRLNEVQVDGRVVLIAVALSLVAGLAFGLVPALRFGRTVPGDVLKESTRTGSDGRSSARLSSTLIASQVALSALLLVAGGLFFKSFLRVIHADKGFTAEAVLAVDVPLTPSEYPTGDQRNAFYEAAMREISSLPGVTGTALTNFVPLEGEAWVESIYKPAPDGKRVYLDANFRFITPNYFGLMGIPILTGRGFTDADRGANRMVIAENTARALWPGESAVGKRAALGGTDSVYEVIGVSANVRTSGLEREPSLSLYRPYWEFGRAENIIVRSSIDPASLAPQVRRIIRALSPSAPISKMRTMGDIVSQLVAQRRFELILIELFALSALLTACVGIYGIVSHTLGRRSNEISIRIALGAAPRNIHGLVLQEVSRPVAIGLVIGLLLAVAIGRALASLLYEVQSTDGTTLLSVAIVLATVAAMACWIPSRRATRLDPVNALRSN